jgi:hypothetical protein
MADMQIQRIIFRMRLEHAWRVTQSHVILRWDISSKTKGKIFSINFQLNVISQKVSLAYLVKMPQIRRIMC